MLGNYPIRSCSRVALCGLICLAVGVAQTPPSTTPAKSASSSTSKSATHKRKHPHAKSKATSSKKRGQKAIDSERTQQIQKALIREHYLNGEPSGKWDESTQAALRRYQADQGWQSKTVPDSRALIKLGLGPSHDHLLNPETAMTTAPTTTANPTKPAATKLPVQPATSSETMPHQ